MISWIDCTSWELDFFGLPHRIPWPSDIDPAVANREPFEMEHLLRAIHSLDASERGPWQQFADASDKFAGLAEALEENEVPQAVALLDEIAKLLPEVPFVLFHQAYVARQEGREEDAIKLYQRAVEKAPKVGPIWLNLGATLAAAGRRDEAVVAFQRVLQCNQNDPMALEGLAALRAVVKLKTNDPQRGQGFAYVDMPTFEQMTVRQLQSMTDPDQLQEYGEQLLRDGMVPPVAVQAIERAHFLRPGNPRTMFVLSGAYHHLGEMDKAREVMNSYIAVNPNDPQGYFRLAQIENGSQNPEAERAALDRVLEVDPNFQPAIGIRFGLGPNEHDPAKEEALAKFGKERNSWMAYVIASSVARARGDHPAALRQAERALAINPENEDVLLHYCVALGGAKDLGKLATVIKPAVESGKHSKRLDWNYAQVLRELGLMKDAVAALTKAAQNAPEDFRQQAMIMVDSWTGMVSGCGVPLEINSTGMLQRPILITLSDGDGGIVIDIGKPLPQEGRFPWRATGAEAFVTLQQGHSGSRDPRSLGTFRIRGITASSAQPTTVECIVMALPDGNIHFRAVQGGRKLNVAWAHSAMVS